MKKLEDVIIAVMFVVLFLVGSIGTVISGIVVAATLVSGTLALALLERKFP